MKSRINFFFLSIKIGYLFVDAYMSEGVLYVFQSVVQF